MAHCCLIVKLNLSPFFLGGRLIVGWFWLGIVFFVCFDSFLGELKVILVCWSIMHKLMIWIHFWDLKWFWKLEIDFGMFRGFQFELILPLQLILIHNGIFTLKVKLTFATLELNTHLYVIFCVLTLIGVARENEKGIGIEWFFFLKLSINAWWGKIWKMILNQKLKDLCWVWTLKGSWICAGCIVCHHVAYDDEH